MNWTNLHAELHKTLRHRKLLAKNQSVLVAVSGGQDSLCLLRLLADLQPKWGWKIAIAHCDHRWPTDVGIAERVAAIARNWQIPFYLETAREPIAQNEAAARKWRYQTLIAIAEARGFQNVVTGHTKTDRAETVLYNLIRGAGADGIAALNWQRALTPEITLVRPLLNISRHQTGAFCQQFNIAIVEDVLNQNLKYSRNRIRAELIPYLQAHFNPQAETALARAAELLRADVEYLEAEAAKILQQTLTPDRQAIDRICLQPLPLALQRRVMRQFWREVWHKYPSFEQIEALISLIFAPNKTRTSSFAKGISAAVCDNLIVFNKNNQHN